MARREFLKSLTETVAENGTSVLLSSHLVADLERVCDYVVMINDGQVQVAGGIDELLAVHRLLVGPRIHEYDRPPGVDVVRAQHTERQSSLWVRGAAYWVARRAS